MFYKDDYLYISGTLDKNTNLLNLLKDDKQMLLEVLAKGGYQPWFKIMCTEFFIPFNLSMIKYQLNDEYMREPFYLNDMYESVNQFGHICTEMKRVKDHLANNYPDFFHDGKPLIFDKGTFDNISKYPKWFFCAFPDVVCWILFEGGAKELELYFKSNRITFNSKNELATETLKAVIDKFKSFYHHLKGENLQF